MTDYDHYIEIEYCYDIVLIDAGENRAKVIGLIRQLNHMNISMKDVQSMIGNVPCVVVVCLERMQARHWQNEFENIGATVELNEY